MTRNFSSPHFLNSDLLGLFTPLEMEKGMASSGLLFSFQRAADDRVLSAVTSDVPDTVV